jgi:hypothetical protein
MSKNSISGNFKVGDGEVEGEANSKILERKDRRQTKKKKGLKEEVEGKRMEDA